MTKHPFLSPDWITAALEIRDELAGSRGVAAPPLRVNLHVTNVPFGTGTIAASIDTSRGSSVPVLGTIADADASITLEHETARTLLLSQDPQAVMTAFLMGQIRIDGDIAKLVELQQLDQSPDTRALAIEINRRVLEITAD
ncbi:MAG: hypothetical protein OEU32_08550 [Acidimicrobiia bacterium]|nr:hypothetical protein [Acidimicrobiia bacterium]